MTRLRFGAAATLIGFTAAACSPPGPPLAVGRWFQCLECAPADSQAVLQLGDAAVPSLRAGLFGGPPGNQIYGRIEQINEQYRGALRARSRFPAAAVPGLENSADYRRRYYSNYVTEHQKRSAIALRAINTQTARAALTALRQLHATAGLGWRADLKELVDRLDRAEAVLSVGVSGPAQIHAGQTTQLIATVRGIGAFSQTAVWTSSDAARLALTAGGTATGLATGGGPVLARACAAANPTVCGQLTITVVP